MVIVFLVINYLYLINFTSFHCSYTKNRIKYLVTSSRSFIEGAVSLNFTKNLQDILLRKNVTSWRPRYSLGYYNVM